MRNQRRRISVSGGKASGLACLISVLAFLVLGSYGLVRLADSRRAAAAVAAPPMQLVRLNINSDAGMVRVEVTADRPFAEADIEQSTRGRETVIHIRGARSLLQKSYAVDEVLARGVRTVSGERDGEPFVDLYITLGEGATIAQKKIFNRLVIGIAADFAHLRRRAPAGPASSEQARTALPAAPQRAASSGSHPASQVASQAAAATAAGPSVPAAASNGSFATNASAEKRAAQGRDENAPEAARASHASASASSQGFVLSGGSPVFRGRNIWSNLVPSVPFVSRADLANVPALFFQTPNNLQTQNSALSSSMPPVSSFMSMTLDAPGASRGTWVPGTTTSAIDQVGGKPFGPGILRPSFLLGAGYEDNFFYRSAAGRALGIFTLAPRLEYEVPGEHRAMRVSYEADLRRLTNGEWANGHKLDFDSRIEFSPYLSLSVRDHFVRSPLDPREYDPAGEVYIVGDTFNRNDAGLRLDYQFDERTRLATDMDYNYVNWSDQYIAGAPLFINYREPQFDISFERDVSERTTALAVFTYGATYSTMPLRAQFDGLNNRRRFAFEVGARTSMSQTSGLALRAGFENSTFYNAPDGNDFKGLIFNLAYRRDLTEKTNFELTALRKTQVSAFNLEGGNARLLTTGGAARLERTLREALKVALGLSYQQLDFPMAVVPGSTASGGVEVGQFAGLRRRDHLYGLSLESAYRWSEYFRSHFVYNFSRRDANIPVLTFNQHRLSMVFELGRRNDVRGRSF